MNRGVRSLLREPTNGGVLKNGFSYDGDKNGERLPCRPPPSLAIIHQPWDEDFQEMHRCLPAVVNNPPVPCSLPFENLFLSIFFISLERLYTVCSLCVLREAVYHAYLTLQCSKFKKMWHWLQFDIQSIGWCSFSVSSSQFSMTICSILFWSDTTVVKV